MNSSAITSLSFWILAIIASSDAPGQEISDPISSVGPVMNSIQTETNESLSEQSTTDRKSESSDGKVKLTGTRSYFLVGQARPQLNLKMKISDSNNVAAVIRVGELRGNGVDVRLNVRRTDNFNQGKRIVEKSQAQIFTTDSGTDSIILTIKEWNSSSLTLSYRATSENGDSSESEIYFE